MSAEAWCWNGRQVGRRMQLTLATAKSERMWAQGGQKARNDHERSIRVLACGCVGVRRYEWVSGLENALLAIPITHGQEVRFGRGH
jgi:hypothetical protein